ncbi:hypothetical protein EDD18DRAFT_1098031 [Armillaria luteobubalina]|uniref:Uncharacterized protein n=1 Tax=Armillaria luteobubalina TaxID=153913 RepID=A0AA39V140_9AGAR|nr:hypothetical protein EDD18DRAFT_1098031 [Armillaria luteobubalina]
MTTIKKVTVLPSWLTVDDQLTIHDDMDLTLSCLLPGVQAALGALDPYEADLVSTASAGFTTAAPNAPAMKLNASANSFVPMFIYPIPSWNHKIKITKDCKEKTHHVFTLFTPDKCKSPDSGDDMFVVKMPKRWVLEDDEGWIGFGEKEKAQRKDLFDALTHWCRSAVPDKTSSTEDRAEASDGTSPP